MTTSERPGAVHSAEPAKETTSPGATEQADPDDRARLSARLRGSSMGAMVMLIIQFALGIGVNLYISPAKGGLGEAFSNGPLLAIHAVLGLLLVAAAVSHLVLAIRARRGAIIGASVVGLLAIAAAAFSGARFLSDHANGASLAMAIATAVAMFCYAVCLRIEGERRIDG